MQAAERANAAGAVLRSILRVTTDRLAIGDARDRNATHVATSDRIDTSAHGHGHHDSAYQAERPSEEDQDTVHAKESLAHAEVDAVALGKGIEVSSPRAVRDEKPVD